MSRSMRQRLSIYHSLHRPPAASHPLSTLTVSPPSTSRPVLSAPPRLPSEAPKQSPHSQLALTQPSPGLQQAPLFPYSPPILVPAFALTPAEAHAAATVPHPTPDIPRAHKRARLQYQLDVGAYGIPKTRAAQHQHHRSFHSRAPPPVPHTHRSVQVGEDAYFVTHNALGIADGVGGWARIAPQHTPYPSPSALFSRRLMHFCAAELEALDSAPFTTPSPTSSIVSPSGAPVYPPMTTRFSFEHHLKPRPAPDSYILHAFAELEDSLEELADGIDVLQILERAYDSTVREHVVPGSSSPTPLTTGSSTALIAVLDYPPVGPMRHNPEPPLRNYAAGSLDPSLPSNSNPNPNSSHSQASADPVKDKSEQALPAEPPTQTHAEATHAKEIQLEPEYDAVVHIAHLGDCMGMLVRGDEIVWRSDEMWWGYNHPLQLGPPPPGTSVHITTKPTSTTTTSSTSAIPTATSSSEPASASASSTTTSPAPSKSNESELIPLPVLPHTFTLPVRASDILILASDGLGDNLWDEDVLDEVLRVRASAGLGFDGLAESTAEKAMGKESEMGKMTTSAEGIMEGLRKAFVGLEVGEGVSAAAASSSNTTTAYPSPPPSTSPSPPNELAASSASNSSTPAVSPSSSSRSSSSSRAESSSSALASAVANAARRKAFASTLAEALCSRAKRVSERRGGSSGISRSSGIFASRVPPQAQAQSQTQSQTHTQTRTHTHTQTQTETQTQTQAQAHSRSAAEKAAANVGDAPVAPGEVPFGRRAALAGRVFRGGKSDDISVIVAVISPSPISESEVSGLQADGVTANAMAGVESVQA